MTATCDSCTHYRPLSATHGICGRVTPRAVLAGLATAEDGTQAPIVVTLRPEVQADEPSCWRWEPGGARGESAAPSLGSQSTADASPSPPIRKPIPVAGQSNLWCCYNEECSGVTDDEGGVCDGCERRAYLKADAEDGHGQD